MGDAETRLKACRARVDSAIGVSLLAPAAPGVTIRTEMRRVAKIIVRDFALCRILDLWVVLSQRFLHQRIVALDCAMERLLRRSSKLGKQAPRQIGREFDIELVMIELAIISHVNSANTNFNCRGIFCDTVPWTHFRYLHSSYGRRPLIA